MIGKYIQAGAAVARELRRGLLGLDSLKRADWFQFWTDSKPLFDRADNLTTRILRDAQLAGWVDAAENIFRRANVVDSDDPRAIISMFDHPLLPDAPFPLTNVNEGVRNLQSLRAVRRHEFDSLEKDARQLAFTVARVSREDAVENVRNVLAEAIQTGQTYRDVRPALREALDSAPLGEHHVEALYRTYVGRAQTAGKWATLHNPMVRDEFPYLLWSATHDGRTEQSHLDMEKAGLDGTAVYRADDPIWYQFLPPARWNCRCEVIILSIEDAAAHGCREAQKWERTGSPPIIPQFVHKIPLKPVKGWVPTGGRLLAA